MIIAVIVILLVVVVLAGVFSLLGLILSGVFSLLSFLAAILFPIGCLVFGLATTPWQFYRHRRSLTQLLGLMWLIGVALYFMISITFGAWFYAWVIFIAVILLNRWLCIRFGDTNERF